MYYLTTARIPGERAHSIQIIKTCDAVRHLGTDVVIVAPHRKNPFEENVQNIRQFYDLRSEPRIIKLPTIDTFSRIHNEALSFLLINITFFVSSLFFLFYIVNITRPKGTKFLFIREPLLLLLFTVSYPIHRLPIMYEVHDGFSRAVFRLSFRVCSSAIKAIITVNRNQKYGISKWMPSLEAKITVIPHAFDLGMFKGLPEDRMMLRRMLGLPVKPKIIMYAGQLSAWKKPEFIVNAISKLGKKLKDQLLLVFVGGNPEDIGRLRTHAEGLGIKNIYFSGFVPPSKVPLYLKSADVLVHYSPAMGSKLMSPSALKVFEYMAAKRPVLAPSGMEMIKDGINVLSFDPTSPEDLASKIEALLGDPVMQEKLSINAFKDVMKYTYEKRAKKILGTITNALK